MHTHACVQMSVHTHAKCSLAEDQRDATHSRWGERVGDEASGLTSIVSSHEPPAAAQTASSFDPDGITQDPMLALSTIHSWYEKKSTPYVTICFDSKLPRLAIVLSSVMYVPPIAGSLTRAKNAICETNMLAAKTEYASDTNSRAA